MKAIIFIVFTAFLSTSCASQSKLANTYSSFSQVYGGMQDGGISKTESYRFVASGKIQFVNIYLNDTLLSLKKGEKLVVNVSQYVPYNNQSPIPLNGIKPKEKQIEKPPLKEKYEARLYNGVYYVNINENYYWPKSVNYVYKKKTFTAIIKENFDSSYTGFAP
jgi:hypothetical protein